jgi:hypothetical protein
MGRIYEATWGRVFAALYDRALKASEEGGLRAMRAELLAGASGRVLEIGAGTGANLGLYPDAVGELVLVEPSPFMARQMRERLGGELAQAPDPAAAEPGPGVDPDPGSNDTAAEPDVGGRCRRRRSPKFRPNRCRFPTTPSTPRWRRWCSAPSPTRSPSSPRSGGC